MRDQVEVQLLGLQCFMDKLDGRPDETHERGSLNA